MAALPSDTAGQKYVQVSALVAGTFVLLDCDVYEDMIGDTTSGSRVPSLAFLIQHEKYGKVLFDLGLRKNGEGYPPIEGLQGDLASVQCEKDVVDQLSEGGITPADISSVIYSHLHFDHVGNLEPFSKSILVVGRPAKPFLDRPFPINPKSSLVALPVGQKTHWVDFEAGAATTAKTADDDSLSGLFASSPIVSPIGDFKQAVDLFQDGSFYLLDAPGHYPGHLNALARIGPNKFILLAADCCHNRQCYHPGTRLISSWNHDEIDVARSTIDGVKAMDQRKNVVVVIAHEAEFPNEAPLFPKTLNEWASEKMSGKA